MASIRHTTRASRRCAYCTRRETRLLSYDNTHVHKTYLLASCVLCTSRNQMASKRYHAEALCVLCTSQKPYDTRLCRETRWRPYDTQCTFIRHYVLASCIVCTSRNPMASIRPTVHVHRTFVFASCVLCTSCNQMTSIRQIVRIRLDIVRTVHVAKLDSARTTLASVAKLDGLHTTDCARASRRCAYCTRRETRLLSYDTTHVHKTYVLASCIVRTSRNLMASIRHSVHVHMIYVIAACVLCTSRKQMAFIRH